ncbi:MAG: hypothetical protein Q7K98_07915 [Candidatus Omnitrophota bacterium]|nr:hypothetical protein [Candidatus Omnitrophota bacterium]
MESSRTTSSAVPFDRNRLLFEELLETDFKGSIYHPNFADIDINLENGFKQTSEKFEPTTEGKLKNGFLNRFHILSRFFRQKPYAFSLSADRSRQIENREFFERQIVDATTYRGSFGLKNKFIPASLFVSSSSKTIDRQVSPVEKIDDKQLRLNLSNQSALLGETRFEASQDQFLRTTSDIPDQEGTARDFDLWNQKSLSEDNKKLLNSSLHFYGLSGTSKSSAFNLNENLNIDHTDYLNSAYNYNFQDRTSSGTRIRDHKFNAALRHRFYESLTSLFNPYYFKSDSASFSRETLGFNLDEDYVKKLGKIGRFSSGFGLNYAEEQRKAFSGIISIIEEPHILRAGTTTFLDQPNVNTATVTVRSSDKQTKYNLGIDYQLNNVGERTQIQILLSEQGHTITDGAEVLIDYQARVSPSLKFNTLAENFRLRMDFLDNLFGVFYRLNKQDHPRVVGDQDNTLETLSDTVVGVDFHFKNIDIEFENEDYDSNLSPYRQIRLRESVFFNPTPASTLTFQSSQSKIRLLNTRDTQKFFDFISRYFVNLTRHMRFNAEAGFRWQGGAGVSLNDLIASAGFELNLGKFLMDIRYDFKNQLNLGERLVNHFIFTKIKRKF